VVGIGVDVRLGGRVGAIVGVSVDAAVVVLVEVGTTAAGAQLDKSKEIKKIRKRFFNLSFPVSL